MALHAVFHSAIHGLAACDYTPEQIGAWSPKTVTVEMQDRWVSRMRAIQPYVAEIEGRVAAYADLQASGYIDHFFVAAEFARQGIGSALMLHIHEMARKKDLTMLYSEVSRTAQPFFQAFGFSVVEHRAPIVRGVEVPNAVMHKNLATSPSVERTSSGEFRSPATTALVHR